MSDELINAEVERRVQAILNSDAFTKRCESIVNEKLDAILRTTPAATDISVVGTLTKADGNGARDQGGLELVARHGQEEALRRAQGHQEGLVNTDGVPLELQKLVRIEHIEG